MTTFAKSLKTERRQIVYTKKLYERIKSESAKDFRGIEDEVLFLIARGLHYGSPSAKQFDPRKYI